MLLPITTGQRLARSGWWHFFNFCQKLVFLAMSLAPDMLPSQSRALKTRIRVKNAKNIWDKKWRIWPEPRARKPSLKRKNTLPLWRRQWKAQTQGKNFFSISGTRLAESIEGLNTSLALAAGKAWLCKLFKYFQQKLGRWDWEGYRFWKRLWLRIAGLQSSSWPAHLI